MEHERLERALRAGPPFHPAPLPTLPIADEMPAPVRGPRRGMGAVLTFAMVVVVASVALAVYQAVQNVGSPDARVTVPDAPRGSFDATPSNEPNVLGLGVQLYVPDGPILWLSGTIPVTTSYPEDRSGATRGVTLAYTEQPEVHECPAEGHAFIEVEPVRLLEDLVGVAGVELGPIERSVVDGRATASAEVLGFTEDCGSDIHLASMGLTVTGRWLDLSVPSRLTAIDGGDGTYLIHAWASTDAELEDWLAELAPAIDAMIIVGSDG